MKAFLLFEVETSIYFVIQEGNFQVGLTTVQQTTAKNNSASYNTSELNVCFRSRVARYFYVLQIHRSEKKKL